MFRHLFSDLESARKEMTEHCKIFTQELDGPSPNNIPKISMVFSIENVKLGTDIIRPSETICDWAH